MVRRSALAAAAATAALVAACASPPAAPPSGGVKMTVLYPMPADPQAFEKYYSQTHLPIAYQVKGVRFELSKGQPGANGAAPSYYRVAEIYFDSPEQMRTTMASPEWKRMTEDFRTFATKDVIVVVSKFE